METNTENSNSKATIYTIIISICEMISIVFSGFLADAFGRLKIMIGFAILMTFSMGAFVGFLIFEE